MAPRGKGITKPFNKLCCRKDRYKRIKSRRFRLSDTPNCPFAGWDARKPRLCLYGEFEHIASRKRIHVFNTYFDHIGAEARRLSAALVISRIKEWTGEDSTARILFMEDLNASITVKTVHDTLKTHHSEALEHIPDGQQGPEGVHSNFDDANVTVNRTDFNYQRNLRFGSNRHIEDKRPNGRHLSDHLTVPGKFNFCHGKHTTYVFICKHCPIGFQNQGIGLSEDQRDLSEGMDSQGIRRASYHILTESI